MTSFILALIATLPAHSASSVVLIGDSHSVLSFGSTIAGTQPGILRYAVSAAAAKDWLKPKICALSAKCELNYGYATPEGNADGTPPPNFPGLKEIIRNHKPAMVLIALGTNDASLGCRAPDGKPQAQIRRLIQLTRGRSCVWIGPPTYTRGPVLETCGADYNRFVNELKRTVKRNGCRFIDSREIVNPATNQPIEANAPDQVHFESELGAFWAREALAKIGALP